MKIKIVNDEQSFIYEASIKDIDNGFVICYNEVVDDKDVLNKIGVFSDKIIYEKTGQLNSKLEFIPGAITDAYYEYLGYMMNYKVRTKNIRKMDGIISIDYDIIIDGNENKQIIIYY